jgi:hypothetical protein
MCLCIYLCMFVCLFVCCCLCCLYAECITSQDSKRYVFCCFGNCRSCVFVSSVLPIRVFVYLFCVSIFVDWLSTCCFVYINVVLEMLQVFAALVADFLQPDINGLIPPKR